MSRRIASYFIAEVYKYIAAVGSECSTSAGGRPEQTADFKLHKSFKKISKFHNSVTLFGFTMRNVFK